MNKRILIVEDEKNIVDILSFNLSKEGYETLEAYDGEAVHSRRRFCAPWTPPSRRRASSWPWSKTRI